MIVILVVSFRQSRQYTMRLSPVLCQLYPHHIPTSLLQKILLAGGSAAAALSDPWRDDMVAVNGEVTGAPALRYMLDKVSIDLTGFLPI